MEATISATRAFFLGTRSAAGDSFSEAFIDPVPGLQLASHRRVTDRLVVLGDIIAEETDRPAVFNIAKVARPVG
jgi:hypothetical protein